MRRAGVLAVVLIGAGFAGCAQPAPDAVDIEESFEQGLASWERDADVPDDPNRPGQKVNWTIQQTRDRARTGKQSAQMLLDGRQDDGTIWLQREVPVQPDRRYRINVTAHAYSRTESFNTIAHLVLVAGPGDPGAEGDFPAPGNRTVQDGRGREVAGGLREPLDRAAGWEPYSFEWVSPGTADASLHVAVGITAVWETEMTYEIDDVQIVAAPV